MAEILAVEVSSFFQESAEMTNRVVFPAADAMAIKFHDLPEGSVHARLLPPVDFEPRAEPYLIEIPSNKNVPSHFFIHKGEEVGYVLSGKLQLKLNKAIHTASEGDVIYLTSEIPTQWKNPGPDIARLLWMKIK
jgi:quercetin dioxygenase-like cupin family protein